MQSSAVDDERCVEARRDEIRIKLNVHTVATSLVIWLCGLMLSLRVLAISSTIDRTTGIVGMFLAGLLVTNCLSKPTSLSGRL
jgi:hypothetical protein